MWWGWAVVALVAIGYVALSQRLDRVWITAPMVFVTLGLVAANDGLGLVTVELDGELVDVLFKATLALLLFVEAASIRPRELRSEAGLVARLLAISMPLAIAIGAAAALVFFDVLSFWEAAVVGAILVPTDAALSQAVVSNERVPAGIRRTLVAESGLNDGLAVPFALAFTAAALAQFGIETKTDALTFALEQIGFGILAGLMLGAAGGWLVRKGVEADWAASEWVKFSPIAAVLLVFAGAEVIHGNEFIAAWVGGITFGYVVRPAVSHVEEFSHRLSQVLTVISFFVFGAILLGPALSLLTWQMVVYGLVSLALVRPIAVALGVLGARLPWQTTAFFGWFGPRGIASVILATIVIKEAGLPGDDVIVLIMTITVALSVYLHGLSAVPGANRYADWYESEAATDTTEAREA